MTNKNQKNKIKDLIYPLKEINKRFEFIQDKTLRNNVSLTLQYILILIKILDQEKLNKTSISSAFYKDMIISCATITEGCLHYCLKKYIDAEKVDISEIIQTNYKYNDCKVLHKISDTKAVCGVVRHEEKGILTDTTNFIIVNRSAKKAGILTKNLFDKSETLRQQRNKIHLIGLKKIDNTYTKQSYQKSLKTTGEIVRRIEKLLSKIN